MVDGVAYYGLTDSPPDPGWVHLCVPIETGNRRRKAPLLRIGECKYGVMHTKLYAHMQAFK